MSKLRRHGVNLSTAFPHAPKPRSGAAAEWNSAAHDAGVPVEQLILEVAQFRVALEADMTIAAAAAELGDDAWASEIIDNERGHLADFERRTMRALAAAERVPARRPSFGERLPKVWMAAAAAIALITALSTGVGRSDNAPQSTSSLALAAATRYADFAQLASGGSTADQLTRAAELLHESLADLVLRDPDAAMQVASILNNEQQQLLRFLPDGTSDVLLGARALVARLTKDATRPAARVISQVKIQYPPASYSQSHPSESPQRSSSAPSSQPSAKPSPTPQASATPSPRPSPSPTSTPAPTSSPGPTSSPQPTDSPVIPGAPAVPKF